MKEKMRKFFKSVPGKIMILAFSLFLVGFLVYEFHYKNLFVFKENETLFLEGTKKFLERNRIVAGLGIGTLVIEAGERSGTSVTARYTQQNGNPVFCIPSSLENKKGKTTNELIQKGAKLVVNVEDIVCVYRVS